MKKISDEKVFLVDGVYSCTWTAWTLFLDDVLPESTYGVKTKIGVRGTMKIKVTVKNEEIFYE